MLRTSYSIPHIISLLGEVVNRPLPADAATIPADARGAFHLPPAADKPVPALKSVSGVGHGQVLFA